VMSNPPYSAQQGSENDNNQNLAYPRLDARIRTTYAAASAAMLKKNLYDSYVRAIRWTSDRIKNEGIIGFVTNGSFIDANNMDGLRKSLMREFSAIYCFNLRGNQRTSGELSRKEGGKIFGSGSRTPVAITLLVKDPKHSGSGQLFYHDIGDYLPREAKLHIIRDFGSIEAIPWKTIIPNTEGDWINQRNPEFETFMPLGDKAEAFKAVFSTYSLGVVTGRDAWAYNFSRSALTNNMGRMIAFYNQEAARYKAVAGKMPSIDDFVDGDPKKISWTVNLKDELSKGRRHNFEVNDIVCSLYRPFTKQRLYFNRRFNERVYQMPRIFPTPRHQNIVISVTGIGATKAFSAVVTNIIPNLHLHDTGQCFPLYCYEKAEDVKKREGTHLFGTPSETPDADGYMRREAITDWALGEFHKNYRDKGIGKEDIFYYVYGLLHSPQYRDKYESSLTKMLPRIPFAGDFWGFSKAGRELAQWHLNYESIEPYALSEQSEDLVLDAKAHYRVEKMVFAKSATGLDKSTIIYNSRVRLSGIPPKAYEYVVNGKSAIDWIMERYAVTVDRDSGIRNDPNDWSDDPRYIVDLVKRVVRVSVETVRIVKGLPTLAK
ncbi:MAG: type ISP restriction/modification enzyme, partial [Phycisphaerae bacterium]